MSINATEQFTEQFIATMRNACDDFLSTIENEYNKRLDSEQASAAAAIEAAHANLPISSAYAQGAIERQQEIITLLQNQLQGLNRSGFNAMGSSVLNTAIRTIKQLPPPTSYSQ
jgi:hypothetical protein